MHKEAVRLLFAALVLASAGVAHAQQPPPPEPVPPAEPAPLVEPAPEPASEQSAPPEAPPAPEAAVEKKSSAVPVAVTYDKGIKFESEDGRFEARLGLRTQFRLQIDKGTEDGAEWRGVGSIPRGRLQLDGHLFGGTVYKLEFSLADKTGYAFTKDLYLEQPLAGGKVALRVGQFKGPFNRQELVSDFGSEFNERAITARWVRGGRDIGVLLHNGYVDKAPEGLEWAVGVFNGFAGGQDEPEVTCAEEDGELDCPLPVGTPVESEPALYGRVGWNVGEKLKGYSEGDLEGGGLRFGVGLSYKVGLAQLKAGDEDSVSDNMPRALGLDAALKVAGFDASVGVFLLTLAGEDTGVGAHIQGGYFLVPKKVQVAARYAFIPNAGDPDEQDIEVLGAFNYYFQGHAWKWATDFGFTQAGAGTRTDAQLRLRTMAQLTF